MRPVRRAALIFTVALVLVAGIVYVFRDQVLAPLGIRPPSGDAGVAALKVPDGFTVTVFADGLDQPRFMAVGPEGILFVAERGADQVVAMPDDDGDGKADFGHVIAEGLNSPSSLDVRLVNRGSGAPGGALPEGASAVYIGESDRVTRLAVTPWRTEEGEARINSVEGVTVVDDLPTGGFHTTRTVIIGLDDRLYVSAGSTCNVCDEEDPRRAALTVYDDLGQGEVFAHGLRNAVGLAIHPWLNEIWATNNGRDLMGNDMPPETVYRIEEGMDAGWPRCHAGSIPDPGWSESDDPCAGVAEPILTMQAHSAPLGLAFYDSRSVGDAPARFPDEYSDSLYMAYHGSWNRVPPTGYKIVRVPLDDGAVAGPPEDFAAGWLLPDGDSLGRPVGVTVAADGALLVSDDKGGRIYRIAPDGK